MCTLQTVLFKQALRFSGGFRFCLTIERTIHDTVFCIILSFSTIFQWILIGKRALIPRKLIRYNSIYARLKALVGQSFGRILPLMQSYWRAVVFYFFALSILLCVFLGCSDAPRVRLVKDDNETFHFQWAEPLKEERIILVRLSGVIFDPRYKAEYAHEEELLVYFPPGTVVSYAIDRPRALEYTSMAILGRIDSVEILPAALRETVLPADVWKIGEDGLFRGHGKRIFA